MPSPWSDDEVRLAVQDYFDMLLKELRGEKYVKSDHNRLLASKLNSRSKGSVEFKHENISAVLLEMQLPYIDGYKPRKNVQGLLRDVVAEYVEQHHAEIKTAATITDPEPIRVENTDWKSILVDPPQLIPEAKAEPSIRPAKGRRFNFPEQEARNRRLGQLGEEFTVQYETFRLEAAGKKDLARHIEWVSQKDDTAGFDILSFGDDDKERFIEVKTTNYARSFPFMISKNEVEFSQSKAKQYALYRLFTFRSSPRLFMLQGDIRRHCQLEPTTYRANFGGAA